MLLIPIAVNSNLISANLIDPVHYLDILGATEDSDQPHLRLSSSVRSSIPRRQSNAPTSSDGSRRMPSRSNDGTEGQTNGIGHGYWTKVKDIKLEDMERELTGVTSTKDDIPLVHAPRSGSKRQ